MPIEILMPALSPTMTEGNLAKWHKKEGDKVKPGEVIAEIETDKAIMEVESVDSGVLGKLLVNEGTQNVQVNEVIALLLEDGEDKSVLKDYKITKAENKQPEKSGDKPEKEIKNSVAPQTNNSNNAGQGSYTPQPISPLALFTKKTDNPENRQRNLKNIASPLAKKIAGDKGVDLNRIKGTGPNGRIVREDVENFVKFGSGGGLVSRDAAEYFLNENDQMRKTIAMRLLQSKQHVPHFYETIECNIDKLLEVRQDINAKAAKDESGKEVYKVSVNDLVIKASALALKQVPKANASWTDSAIVQYTNVDISVAVALESGLITPIIRNADQKNVVMISNEMKDLAKRARTTGLKPEEFQGGGFSISNLGMYGIDQFNAIINPPQSCILAVGAGVRKPVVIGNEIVIATMMNVTLSCDHRVVDGVLGAQFLKVFKDYIEKPVTMFL